jgi:hypothetical protein
MEVETSMSTPCTTSCKCPDDGTVPINNVFNVMRRTESTFPSAMYVIDKNVYWIHIIDI